MKFKTLLKLILYFWVYINKYVNLKKGIIKKLAINQNKLKFKCKRNIVKTGPRNTFLINSFFNSYLFFVFAM